MENAENQYIEKNKYFICVFNYLRDTGQIYNQADFVRKISGSKSFVSEVLGNKREINEHFVRKICSVFTQVNPNYLSDGEGEMLKAEKNITYIGDINGGTTTINKDSPNSNISTTINKGEETLKHPSEAEQFIALVRECMASRDKEIDEKNKQMNRLLTLLENK